MNYKSIYKIILLIKLNEIFNFKNKKIILAINNKIFQLMINSNQKLIKNSFKLNFKILTIFKVIMKVLIIILKIIFQYKKK